jgi:hypothetical protein
MDESLALARSVERLTRAAEAVLIRCVRTWHDRGDPVQTPTTTQEELSWRAADAARKALIVDLGRSRLDAGRLIATAKALRRDSPTAEALRGGEISASQARIIADTVDLLKHMPDEAVAGAREALFDHARSGGTEAVRRTAPAIAHRTSPTAVLNESRRTYERRALTMTPALGGYVPGGFLPASGAEAVLTVLDAMADSEPAASDRTEAQSRADALVRLAEDRLRTGELPHRHGGATVMTVVMRSDTALGLPDAPPAVTGYGQTLPAAEAHLLACEASIRAVLVNGDGEILWQGRRKRVATRAQYEALAVRDGGCTMPTCNRPARECDAHHETPWSEGGRTDVAAMRLLCRRHHRELHDELWLRQYSWQEGKLRACREGRSAPRPQKPWYTDQPAWYPGPSPWNPDGEPTVPPPRVP